MANVLRNTLDAHLTQYENEILNGDPASIFGNAYMIVGMYEVAQVLTDVADSLLEEEVAFLFEYETYLAFVDFVVAEGKVRLHEDSFWESFRRFKAEELSDQQTESVYEKLYEESQKHLADARQQLISLKKEKDEVLWRLQEDDVASLFSRSIYEGLSFDETTQPEDIDLDKAAKDILSRFKVYNWTEIVKDMYNVLDANELMTLSIYFDKKKKSAH